MTMGLAIQLAAASVVLLSALCGAQQGYGLSYPPQLFYLAPNDAAIVLAQHASTAEPPTAKTLPVDAEEGETAQFHSQDDRGRAVFGYLLPDQSRVEERSTDGSVRGAYSYLDPNGRAVKVQYWDSGSGFHTAGNNLPAVSLGLPQPVQDTPEVQAAKEQHFKFVQQALQQHFQHLPPDEDTSSGTDQQAMQQKPQSDGTTTIDSAAIQQALLQQQQQQQQQDKPQLGGGSVSDNAVIQQTLLQHQQNPQNNGATASDSVVVESDDSDTQDDDDSDLTRYPNLQQFPQNLYDPSHMHDANLDAVIVDSSDTIDIETNSLRTGKSSSLNATLTEKKSPSETGQGVGSAVKDSPSEVAAGKEKYPMDKDITNTDTSPSKDEETKLEPVRNKGFFYSFQHPIPIFVQVKTVTGDGYSGKTEQVQPEPLSHSQKAAYFGANPVAAVHDFQVPPWQKEAFKNAGLPLYTEPFTQHNGDINIPLTYSQKAFYFGAIPVAAVHDQQVHPNQRGSFPNHQIAPLYIEPTVQDN